MTGEPKQGLKAAVELALAQTDPSRAGTAIKRAMQLSLLPSEVAIEDELASDEVAERDGPGRPVGSRNKRTEEMTRFILSRYRDPRLVLAETYSRPVEQLAAELGCKPVEAFKIQVAAAEALLPYVAQKQPMAVQISGTGIVQLTIVKPDAPAMMPGDGAVTIEGTIIKTEENQ